MVDYAFNIAESEIIFLCNKIYFGEEGIQSKYSFLELKG